MAHTVAQLALMAFLDLMGDESRAAVDNPESPVHEFNSLGDCVEYWLNEGAGYRDCACNFQVYQTALVLIIEWWYDWRFLHERREGFITIPWRITKIMKDDYQRTTLLDLHWFEFNMQENKIAIEMCRAEKENG
jgi:hypothetical protein